MAQDPNKLILEARQARQLDATIAMLEANNEWQARNWEWLKANQMAVLAAQVR